MEMRERILEKASELFTKYGIKRITMDEIAARLGISKKTIYLSFADKNELVSDIFDRHIQVSRQNCLNDVSRSNNAIHEVLLASETFCITMQSININVLYDLKKYHPDVYTKFIQFKNEFLAAFVSQNLKRGIEEGLYRNDMNQEIVVRMRLANIVLAMNIELFPSHQFRFSDVEREVSTHFLYGIVSEDGARVMKQYISQAAELSHQLLTTITN